MSDDTSILAAMSLFDQAGISFKRLDYDQIEVAAGVPQPERVGVGSAAEGLRRGRHVARGAAFVSGGQVADLGCVHDRLEEAGWHGIYRKRRREVEDADGSYAETLKSQTEQTIHLEFQNVTSVRENAFYGWPWFYTGENEDPRHANERPDLRGHVAVPDVLLQPHSAPLGIAFNTGKQFPTAWEGDAFVALHGSWNRSLHTGYKIVRLPFKDGKPTGEYQDFVVGFTAGEENVWGR
jgi:hypothetical protein